MDINKLPDTIHHGTVMNYLSDLKIPSNIKFNHDKADTKTDFSLGFYTTEDLDQAQRQARRIVNQHRTMNQVNTLGLVVSYNLDKDKLYKYKDQIQMFEDTSKEWAGNVLNNRAGRIIVPEYGHNLDKKHKIIQGPLADGPTIYLVREFIKGNIDFEEYYNGIIRKDEEGNLMPQGDQLSFHCNEVINECLIYKEFKVIQK